MSFDDCKTALQSSSICVLPTETVYGLACSAFSQEAVEKVFTLKNRPSSNPLIVHVLDHNEATKISYTSQLSEKLAKAFWPGPLTMVLPKKKCIPYKITAGLNTVAIRSPSHLEFRKMLRSVKLPLAAPSANKSNKISPTRYQDVLNEFGNDCPPLIDGGPCQIGIESTVLDLTTEIPEILRLGSCSKEDIESVICCDIKSPQGKENINYFSSKSRKSPGQMNKHYAPETPLFIYPSFEKLISESFSEYSDIILLPCKDYNIKNSASKMIIHYLSENGDPKEIAKNLYHALRCLDDFKKDKIFTSLFPWDNGVLSAVNDRLIRASTAFM